MRVLVALALTACVASGEMLAKKKHHKHHKHHKKAGHKANPEVEALKKMEEATKKENDSIPAVGVAETGELNVQGPLPTDFKPVFQHAVLETTKEDVEVTHLTAGADNIVKITLKGNANAIAHVRKDAADENSGLVKRLPQYLMAKEEKQEVSIAPGQDTGVDVNTEMPYGELEPFGREDTAKELTQDSVQESDAMVDQMERAEVAEEKRSVFRALTRLRGAAITSFDGVARSQTGNIDEYNKVHKWRKTHPLHHLAAEEADTHRWAFPGHD